MTNKAEARLQHDLKTVQVAATVEKLKRNKKFCKYFRRKILSFANILTMAI